MTWAGRSGRCLQSPRTRPPYSGIVCPMGRQIRPMFSIPEDPATLLGDRVSHGPADQADVLNPRGPDRLTRGSCVPWAGRSGRCSQSPRTRQPYSGIVCDMGRQVRPMSSIPEDPAALLGDRVSHGPADQADVLNPRRPDRLTRGSCVTWAGRSGRCLQSPRTRPPYSGIVCLMGRQIRPMLSIPEDPTALLGDRVSHGPADQADVLNPRGPGSLTRGSCVTWAGRSGRCLQSPRTRQPYSGIVCDMGRQVRPMSSIPEDLTALLGDRTGLGRQVWPILSVTADASRTDRDQQPGDMARFTI